MPFIGLFSTARSTRRAVHDAGSQPHADDVLRPGVRSRQSRSDKLRTVRCEWESSGLEPALSPPSAEQVTFIASMKSIRRLSTSPNVEFRYLRESAAKIEIVPADARLSLEREAAAVF